LKFKDNDILGIFAPERYTHVTPGWGLVLIVSEADALLRLLKRPCINAV